MPAKEECALEPVDFTITDENGEIKRTDNRSVDTKTPKQAAEKAILDLGLVNVLKDGWGPSSIIWSS